MAGRALAWQTSASAYRTTATARAHPYSPWAAHSHDSRVVTVNCDFVFVIRVWRGSAGGPAPDRDLRRRAQFGPASTRSHWTQTNKSDLFLLSSPRKKEVEALHPPPCAHRASSLTLSTSHRRPSPRRPRRPDLVPFRQTFFSSTVTRTSFRLMKGSVNGGLYPAACHS